MLVTYKKLWEMLVDKDVKKKSLRNITRIGSTTMTKLNNEQLISMNVMVKTCKTFDCNIGDVIYII